MTPEELLAHRRQREAEVVATIAKMETDLAEMRQHLVEVQRSVYVAEDAVLAAGGSIQ